MSTRAVSAAKTAGATTVKVAKKVRDSQAAAVATRAGSAVVGGISTAVNTMSSGSGNTNSVADANNGQSGQGMVGQRASF